MTIKFVTLPDAAAKHMIDVGCLRRHVAQNGIKCAGEQVKTRNAQTNAKFLTSVNVKLYLYKEILPIVKKIISNKRKEQKIMDKM